MIHHQQGSPSPGQVGWGLPVAPPIQPPPTFVSASLRARWTVVLLVVVGALGAVATLLEANEVQYHAPPPGTVVTDDASSASIGRLFVIVAFLRYLPLLVAGIAFLMWIHRAYANLPALGARDLRFTPALAVGGFFIPGLHLYRPYQVVEEIWTASAPDAPDASAATRRGRGTDLLGWWWTLWNLTTALGYYVFGPVLIFSASVTGWVIVVALVDASDTALAVRLGLLTYGIAHLAAVVLAILVVREIDRRQQAKAARSQRVTPYAGASTDD